MRTITTSTVTTIFANITGTVRNLVVGVGTGLGRILSDARFLLKRLAKPATDDMITVRVYRRRPVAGRRPMTMQANRFHCWSSGQQGGSWSKSAVNK